MKSDMRPAPPARPLAAYVGGKKMLARHVIARIEREPHTTYCEVFVGMGGVFFRRRFAPKAEAINDRSRDVATFFRVLQWSGPPATANPAFLGTLQDPMLRATRPSVSNAPR